MRKPINFTPLTKGIVKTLLYYDVFQYPLTESEIFKHLPTQRATPDQVKEELRRLRDESIVYSHADFFSVQDDSGLETRRVKGNNMALESLPIAHKQALFISKFPFVRAVMASGSLSKDYMDEQADLDFFIITKSNRLWIARMLLVLYRKVFLFNSRKYFCTNYFLDENHLEIEEKNIFTATELATLLPLYGKENYKKLIDSNSWIQLFFPHHNSRQTVNVPTYRPGLLKRYLESIINLMGANKLETIFMRLNLFRWRRIYESNFPKGDFEVAFKTKEYVSKGHSRNMQRKVLDLYKQKLDEFGGRLRVNLNE